MARRSGRWVRWLKWAAIALSVVILVVWVGSAWWRAGYIHIGPPWKVEANSGRLVVVWVEYPKNYLPHGEWIFEGADDGFVFWRWTLRSYQIGCPLWTPLPFTLGAAIYLWRRDRRARRPGHCVACGYDLAGLAPGSACPECGKAATLAGQ